MKKVAVLSMTVLFAVTAANGQVQTTAKEQGKETKKEVKAERKALRKLEGNTVSVVARNNFAVDFGKAANVNWKRVDTYDEASFTLDGKPMKAFYDYQGTLVGTTQKASFSDLPASAQKEIKAKYKDYTVASVILFDDNQANDTDMLLYGVQFDDADNYFAELTKGNQKIVLQITTSGIVSFFKQI